MSSLWTPGGEHKIPRTDDPGDPGGPGGPGRPGGPGGGDGNDSTGGRPPARADTEPPDGPEPTEEELLEFTRQLAEAPPEDVVANHCYGLFELAALHLSLQPPRLDSARLAIDSMALLVDGLGQRLGAHAETLQDGLNQLRMAFVRIAEPAGGPAGEAGGADR